MTSDSGDCNRDNVSSTGSKPSGSRNSLELPRFTGWVINVQRATTAEIVAGGVASVSATIYNSLRLVPR